MRVCCIGADTQWARLLDLFSIKSDFVLFKALEIRTNLPRTDDMANLRRHFNFTAKHSSLVEQGSVKSLHQPNVSSATHSSKCHLMEDICNCLDLCCKYVQALNALCGTGTLLAGNLLQAVQEVPAYCNIAQQFFAVWNEVGRATAGASAAVKTETLMMMQEALNALEAESEDTSTDTAISDSFQVIGSCLFSFIELQAEFSLSTWKSLSKLSKSLPNDVFQNTFRHSSWKHDRSPFKLPKNSELSSTIKKHFSQISHKFCTSKPVDSMSIAQSQFYVSPTSRTTETMAHGCGQYPRQMGSSTDVSDSVVWSPSNTLWSSCNTSIKNLVPSSDSHQAQTSSSSHPELDEVINLLSCMPLHTLSSNECSFSQSTQNYESPIKSQPLRKLWPQDSAPLLSNYVTSTESWSESLREIPFGYDSWIWRTDSLNCTSLPEGSLQSIHENSVRCIKQKEHPLLWNNFENQRYIGNCENASSSDDGSSNLGYDADSFPFIHGQPFDLELCTVSKQRRSSSSSSLPNGSDANMDTKNRSFWDPQVQKTSTWPLKQSTSKMFIKPEWPPVNVQSDSENQIVFYS